MSSKPKQFTTSKAGETGDRPREFATFKKMGNKQFTTDGRGVPVGPSSTTR
jgi:hypothetical protein